MRYPRWLIPAILAIASLNFVYTAWAMSLPPDENWMYYMDIEIPADVAAANTPEEVVARLEAAGWDARLNDAAFRGGTSVVAAPPDGAPFSAIISGLGEDDTGWMEVEVFCAVGYLHSDCPHPLEAQLRARLAQVSEASGVPVDVAGAHFGDNDFAMLGGFFLFLGQLLMRAVTAALVGVLAIVVPFGAQNAAPAGRAEVTRLASGSAGGAPPR